MKRDWFKYIVCLLLVTIFVMKGAVTVLPALFTHTFKSNVIEQLLNDEENAQRNAAEEKKTEGIKELYIHHTYGAIQFLPEPAFTQSSFANNRLQYKQSVYPSIPTPPPKSV